VIYGPNLQDTVLNSIFFVYSKAVPQRTENGLSVLLKKCTFIQTLILTGLQNFEDIFYLAKYSINLITIDLSNCKVLKDEHLIELGLNAKNLKVANLNDSDTITDIGIEEFIKNCTTLEHLSLFNCSNLTMASVDIIFTYGHNLKRVHMPLWIHNSKKGTMKLSKQGIQTVLITDQWWRRLFNGSTYNLLYSAYDNFFSK